MKKGKRLFPVIPILLALLFTVALMGIALMLFPQFEQQQSRAAIIQEVTTFKEKIRTYREEIVIPEVTIPEEKPITVLPELYTHMQLYNREIYEEEQKDLVDAFSYANPVIDLTEYGIDDGIVAIVHIPAINVEMPLYLGANWGNLANGLAQLSQTSMPIGGKNTNCVIAGHRGWYGIPFLRDIEILTIGDSIYLETPWETMEYRVCEAPRIILPNETDNILIQEGRDLLTLLTCHPYAICTHRYLLICERFQPELPVAAPETRGYWSWDWVDRVTITTSDGTVVESSSREIFITEFLPWISAFLFLIFLFVCLVAALVLTVIRNSSVKRMEPHNQKD